METDLGRLLSKMGRWKVLRSRWETFKMHYPHGWVEMKRHTEPCLLCICSEQWDNKRVLAFSFFFFFFSCMFFCAFLNVYKEHRPCLATAKMHFTVGRLSGRSGLEARAGVFLWIAVEAFKNNPSFTVAPSLNSPGASLGTVCGSSPPYRVISKASFPGGKASHFCGGWYSLWLRSRCSIYWALAGCLMKHLHPLGQLTSEGCLGFLQKDR